MGYYYYDDLMLEDPGKALLLAQYVATGALWADEVRPGWWKKIDLDKLRMDDGDACICGQLFMEDVEAAIEAAEAKGEEPDVEDGFDYARMVFFGWNPEEGEWEKRHTTESFLEAARRGFCAPKFLPAIDNYDIYEMLAVLWAEQIERRAATMPWVAV